MSARTGRENSLITQLADQLDYHWTHHLRPRLEGLTDDEYFWQPVPGLLDGRPDGSIDFTYPAPEPAPFTTIAWRLAHVIVGVLAMRSHSHFGGPAAGYETWRYATDAATAVRQLDEEYRRWIDGVRGLSDDDLTRPMRTRRRSVCRLSVQRPGPAHQPGNDPPRRRDRLHPRSLRAHHHDEGELSDARPCPHPSTTSAMHSGNSCEYHQKAFFAVSYGLTDEQARSAAR